MPRVAASPPIDAPAGPVEALRRGVLVEHDLGRLVTLFANAIAQDGIGGHFCAAVDEDGQVSPLFGDSPWLLADESAGGGRLSSFVIRGALGEHYLMMFGPIARRLDDRSEARLRGYASLYAARGATLHEKGADPLTACGLSICERFVLGRLLVGDCVLDIALRLDRSPAAIESHIADAMATLGVSDRAAAIALAARRGWLLATANDFSPLSPRNSLYYS